MTIVAIQNVNGTQSVTLPSEFRFEAEAVAIRKEGESVILEPVKAAHWPKGFFDAIRIDDEAFVRPDQGTMPSAPMLDVDEPS
jgi:virulence-associated protein VagC